MELWNRETKGRTKYKYFFPKEPRDSLSFPGFLYARKWDTADDLYRSIDQGGEENIICSHAVERGRENKSKDQAQETNQTGPTD